MSQIVDKGKEVREKAKTSAKAFFTDVMTNFKADEGGRSFAGVMSRFSNLWRSGRNGKIAIFGGVVILLLILKSCFWGGPSFSEDQKVGANFLAAYLSGDFMEAAKYTDRPGTVSGDVEIMYNLESRFKTNEDRAKAKKVAHEGMAKLRQTVLSLGFDGCDIFLADGKGIYHGDEHTHYDNNIEYLLVKGHKEKVVELHLQKNEEGNWKVVAHPFSFL